MNVPFAPALGGFSEFPCDDDLPFGADPQGIAAEDTAAEDRDLRIAENYLYAEGIAASARRAGQAGWGRFTVAEPNTDTLVVSSSAGERALGPTARLAAKILLRIGMRPDQTGARWIWNVRPAQLSHAYPRTAPRRPTGCGQHRDMDARRPPSDAAVKRALARTDAPLPTAGCDARVSLYALHTYAKQHGLAVWSHCGHQTEAEHADSCRFKLGNMSPFYQERGGMHDLATEVRCAVVEASVSIGLWRAEAVLAADFGRVHAAHERHGFVVRLVDVTNLEDPLLILLVSEDCPAESGRAAAKVLVEAGFAEVAGWPGRWRDIATAAPGRTPARPSRGLAPIHRLRRLIATRPDKANGDALHVDLCAPEQGFGGAGVILARGGDWRSGPDDWRPDPIVALTPFCDAAGWLLWEMLQTVGMDRYTLSAAVAEAVWRYQKAVGARETERGLLNAILDHIEGLVSKQRWAVASP